MAEHTVTLIHDNWPAKDAAHFASLAADPPAGFTFSCKTWELYKGITGTREAPTLFHAIADVVAEVARTHGVLLNDAGIEKPREWVDEESNQQTVAHLLLMAAHRAAYCGLTISDLTDFLRAAEPAHGRAGPATDRCGSGDRPAQA
ncbi:hypothetical protein [Streptomyces eurocidicus]|uniref:Uncharacterized protein n=1 Tax=Streptomyces eurocidicus TaxID=66423 RepID=A0A7W8F2L4_STREU|nr:hypothetical protein [Streptomyces eurocidicus]MBB5119672.1 hypothetical protein [Streptomyces eurocidicus]MBF6050699.1 hypothetical protein [Streptomyces eurocidicus]